MSLSDKAEFNPELTSMFSGMKSSITSGIAKLTEKSSEPSTNFSIFLMLAFVAMLVGLYIYYFKASRLFENQSNIRRMSREGMMKQADYDKNNSSRIGLRTYLQRLVQEGVPDTQLVLTNFYISTVNATGVFFRRRTAS